MSSSTSVHLNLRTTTISRLDDFCGTMRIKRDVVAKLVEWFAVQPLSVQHAVMGEVPSEETIGIAYARVLEHMAKELRRRGSE